MTTTVFSVSSASENMYRFELEFSYNLGRMRGEGFVIPPQKIIEVLNRDSYDV